MTRLVPRPDWTPEDVAAAIWAVASSLSDQRYLQLNTPDRIEAFARLPAVLALFRPAEEPEREAWDCTADSGESDDGPTQCGGPVRWDGAGYVCSRCGREYGAPVAPPPAEERADLPASEESSWVPVLVESRTPETESVMIHHAHRGQACVACELAALRAENERLRNLPVAPPPAEERKEWPPKRPKPVALIPTPTCSEERDPWGNAESRVRTLAHEANNEAGADVAIHLFRAAHDAALAALRSELSASQREVERLRQQLDPPTQSGSFGATTAKVAGKCIQCNGDIYHDPHHIGEYLHVCVPSGENRSDG